jgi:signal transduction histidine kinase
MPSGGRLAIKLDEPSNGMVRLEIADTGAGISADIAPRLFTPFASTKPTGTGLGLSICRRIVEEHGGTITAHNRPEGGAVFVVTLTSADDADFPTPGPDATRLATEDLPLTTHHSPSNHAHATGHR